MVVKRKADCVELGEAIVLVAGFTLQNLQSFTIWSEKWVVCMQVRWGAVGVGKWGDECSVNGEVVEGLLSKLSTTFS